MNAPTKVVQRYSVSVNVTWRGPDGSYPPTTYILRNSDLLAALENAGLEITSYGTSLIEEEDAAATYRYQSNRTTG